MLEKESVTKVNESQQEMSRSGIILIHPKHPPSNNINKNNYDDRWDDDASVENSDNMINTLKQS